MASKRLGTFVLATALVFARPASPQTPRELGWTVATFARGFTSAWNGNAYDAAADVLLVADFGADGIFRIDRLGNVSLFASIVVRVERALRIDLPRGQSAFLWGPTKRGTSTYGTSGYRMLPNQRRCPFAG